MRAFCKFILIITCSISPYLVSAQQTEQEKVRALEIQRAIERQQHLDRSLDSAIHLMDDGKYAMADLKFRTVLQNIQSVPSDLAFYFGKNSYYVGKYKQGIDWLNKYIQLKGTAGQFSAEAVEWLRKSEAALLEENQRQSNYTVQVLSSDYTIDCGTAGSITCPVCKGSTVIVKKGYLSDSFSVCPYCHQTGFLSCEDYNLLLKGKLNASTSP